MIRRIARCASKILKSPQEAVKVLKSNSTVLSGGFGLSGVPFTLIKAIARRRDISGLTVVSSNAGTADNGLGILLETGQIKRMVSSYVGENKLFEQLYNDGELEVELTPQGTLAEKIRCGGYGIPVFATHTGTGTLVERGGMVIKYNKRGEPEIVSEPKPIYNDDKGKKFLLEKSIRGDVALVKAWKSDEMGNLIYRKTARNFNQDMAKAADYVIAEVEEIVGAGELSPNEIHTPCIHVDSVVKTQETVKPIERLGNKETMEVSPEHLEDPKYRTRVKIAKRAAKEIHDNSFINLGIGIPTWVPMFVPAHYNVFLQAENGALGLSGYPEVGHEDPDLIDPAKYTVSVRKGASFFSSSDSFGMIRGGHLNWTLLGSLEVSETGDIANWIIPRKMTKGMGGAMDLVSCGTNVMVLMTHTNKKGEPKIIKECTLPITGQHCVNKIITELAAFDVIPGHGLVLTDVAEESCIEEIRQKTGCDFEIARKLETF